MRVPHWLPLALLVLGGGAPAGAGDPQVELITFAEVGPPETSLDILFVAEGYVAGKGERKFRKDLERYAKRLLELPPFSWYPKQLNIRGAFVASADSGCDATADEHSVDTVLDSCFHDADSRLLRFRDAEAQEAIVDGVGHVDIVFVVVNVERYGGAGTVLDSVLRWERPLAAPTFAAQDTPSFLIAVHELGHSFGQLSDEYAELSKIEHFALPTEGDVQSANATLPAFFDGSSFDRLQATVKWGHFLSLKDAKRFEWLHEGGYYRDTGVFRPWDVCLMRSLDKAFCPVCAEELAQAIQAACDIPWDDAAYHKAHPLSLWKGQH